MAGATLPQIVDAVIASPDQQGNVPWRSITLFAGSILVVWVFFAFNDLAVLLQTPPGAHLRRPMCWTGAADGRGPVDRHASTAGCNVAALEGGREQAPFCRRGRASACGADAHGTISKIVAERAGFPDVCAQVIGEVDQVERKRFRADLQDCRHEGALSACSCIHPGLLDCRSLRVSARSVNAGGRLWSERFRRCLRPSARLTAAASGG